MPDTPDRVVRRWFEEVWNQGREETIDDLLAPAAKIYGLPTPDNRPLTGPNEFNSIARIAADKIVEGWNVVDFLTCYQQLGVLPQL